MRLATLAFLLGVLACQTLSQLPDNYWFYLLLPLTLVAWKIPPLRLLLWFAIGFMWMMWRAQLILAQELPFALENKTVTIIGEIVDLPVQRPNGCGWRFHFIVTHLFDEHNAPWSNPGKLRLYWDAPISPLHPGQTWQLSVRLKRPTIPTNPGLPDYARFWFQQGIRATGSVLQDTPAQLLASPSSFGINQLRDQLAHTIKAILHNHTYAGIIVALAIGEQVAIVPDQWRVLQKTGIVHLVAISGVHITGIAMLAFFLAGWLWSYIGKTTLWLPTPQFAAGIGILVAFGYSLLAGFSIPTQRTCIMLTVVLMGIIILRQQIIVSYLLAFALLLVLLYDPLSAMSVGFWLSFGTVSIIIYALNARQAILPYWLEAQVTDSTNQHHEQPSRFALWKGATKLWINLYSFIYTQWIVTLFLIPILLFIFGYVPLISFVANAIAIPLMSLIIVPLTLLGTLCSYLFPNLAHLLLQSAAWWMEWLWGILESLLNIQNWLYSQIEITNQFPPPPLWTVLIALIGMIILLAPRGFPGRWVGIIWVLPLFFTNALPMGEVELTVLDVGQGLSVIIRTHNHVLVYDTGPRFFHSRSNACSSPDAGQSVVVPFLQAQGIRYIDTLLISHGDNDHSGGLSSIVHSLTVKTLIISQLNELRQADLSTPQKNQTKQTDNSPLFTPLPKERLQKLLTTQSAQECQTGQDWSIDGVRFEILHPAANFAVAYPKAAKNHNNHACVLKITAAGGSILLTGDIEYLAEYLLIQRVADKLPADILVVPHHGSKTSSTERFIEAVKPKIALLSTGYKNNFGHPHPIVIQRYQERNVAIFNTVEVGAITLRITAQGMIETELTKKQRRRYWH